MSVGCPIPDRILRRLIFEPNTGCLLWDGWCSEKGYALTKWQGKKTRVTRLLFKLLTGRWPRRDRELLHKCDTPACCNFSCDAATHLREGTRRQNARERHQRGRTRGCVRYAA